MPMNGAAIRNAATNAIENLLGILNVRRSVAAAKAIATGKISIRAD